MHASAGLGFSNSGLLSWLQQMLHFLRPISTKRLGSGISLREEDLSYWSNLNPPKVTCYSSPDCDELMAFNMDVQMGLRRFKCNWVFWQHVQQKPSTLGYWLKSERLVLLSKDITVAQTAGVGRSSCTCMLVRFPAARIVTLWSLPPNVPPCCCLNAIFGKLSGSCASPWHKIRSLIQVSACILVCLSYALHFAHIWYIFQLFTSFESGILSSYWFQLSKCHHLTLWNAVQLGQWTMHE